MNTQFSFELRSLILSLFYNTDIFEALRKLGPITDSPYL